MIDIGTFCPAHGGESVIHAHEGNEFGGSVHIVKDPVCGMDVDSHAAKHSAEHEGYLYYFCSAGCRTKFVNDPNKDLRQGAPAPIVQPGAIYTCPMHPQIRQIGPGACPICGMALEPEIATGGGGGIRTLFT